MEEKAFFFPHNNKLELLWTNRSGDLPHSTGCIWFEILVQSTTSDAPQRCRCCWSNWSPVCLGIPLPWNPTMYWAKIINSRNPSGKYSWRWLWAILKAGMTSIQPEMHIPVGKPVKLVIGAQDVIHDVGLPHFRMKNGCRSGYFYYHVVHADLYNRRNEKRTGNPNFVCAWDQFTRCAVKGIPVWGNNSCNQRNGIKMDGRSEPEYFGPDKDPNKQGSCKSGRHHR